MQDHRPRRPAHTEIVIEGLIDPEKLEPEAPFGESNGYVALEAYDMPMQVTAITHRKNRSVRVDHQPGDAERVELRQEGGLRAALSRASARRAFGIRGVRRVVMLEPLSNLRPVIFVQYAAGTPRSEVWRGMNGTANFNAIAGKIIIAVSEDIDPDNLDAVMWSIAYRCNPVEDVHIPPYHGGVQGSQYSKPRARLEAADRRHHEGANGAAGAAEEGIHGARTGAVGEARSAADHAQAAVARL